MRPWHPDIDPATIPDHVILSERGRRNRAARRTPSGGNKPKKLSPCRWCGEQFGVMEMRAHVPRCPKRPPRGQRGTPPHSVGL